MSRFDTTHPLQDKLSPAQHAEQVQIARVQMEAHKHIMAALEAKLNEIELRRWCIEQAVKVASTVDPTIPFDTIGCARLILDFVSAPLTELLAESFFQEETKK